MSAHTVLYGTNDETGAVGPLGLDPEGHLEVAIQSPAMVFGELLVGSLTPVVQLDFVYGLNTNLVATATTGSGAAAGASRMGQVSTTAATNSSATIYSKRRGKYRPGEAMHARFTAMFTAGAAGSTQMAGVASTGDAFAIGYNGTTFGILVRKGGVDVWTPQTSFNMDRLDGSNNAFNPSGFQLDPTKMNIFLLQYGFLGVRGAVFSVLNRANGKFVPFHDSNTSGVATSLTTDNPTMRLFWQASNTTNATDIKVLGGSGGLFIEGQRQRLGGTYGVNNNKTFSTTETNILTIRNNTTINGVTNESVLRIRSLSVATASNVPVAFKMTKNATLGGPPTMSAWMLSTAWRPMILLAPRLRAVRCSSTAWWGASGMPSWTSPSSTSTWSPGKP